MTSTTKKLLTTFCAVLALTFLLMPTAAQASPVEIFHEDFNDFTGFPGSSNDLGGHRTNFGVPTIAEGADNDWIGARFEFADSDPISNDVGVLKYASGSPGGTYGNPAGRVDDDAGLVIKIDLTFHTDVELSFDWRTFATETNDRLVAAYYVGDDLGDSTTTGVTFDWFNDPSLGNGDMSASDPQGQANTWYVNNWTEVLRATSPSSFQQESNISLPGGDVIYLAFWLDNGDHDLGKIDNIWIEGNEIGGGVPEPSSLAIMLIGLAGSLAGMRRRHA